MSTSNSLRLSRDNFYKKVSSSKGFAAQTQPKGEIYATLIQALKSDLLQIQELINSNTSEINMYKILSKQPGLTKKLSEIQEGEHTMKANLDRIAEESKNAERIGRDYKCSSAQELIQKMNLELGYSELLLNKFRELFILMKLKLCNDDTYQDSPSKIFEIKIFFEKIVSMINKPSKEGSKASLAPLSKKPENSKSNQNEDLEEFLKVNDLHYILDNKDSKNKIFSHLINLLNGFFSQINLKNYNVLFKNSKDPSLKDKIKGSEVDKYFIISDLLEKLIESMAMREPEPKEDFSEQIKDYEEKLENLKISYEEEINSLKKKNEELKDSYEEEINSLKKKNEELKDSYEEEINKLKKYIEELKGQTVITAETNLENSNKDLENELNELKIKHSKEIEKLNQSLEEAKKEIKEKQKEIEELRAKQSSSPSTLSAAPKMDVDEIVRIHKEAIKDMQREAANNLNNEYKELKTKYEVLKNKYDALVKDNENMKRQLGMLNSSKFDPDSYEQVLLQQFNTMKESFMKKVEELTYELEQGNNKHRCEMRQLKQELDETKKLSDIFLNQVLSLQNR
ncbi:MAG: hypothetical protein MJ252_04160 [archaeon]|nr:hypothetical protein [archaeon]